MCYVVHQRVLRVAIKAYLSSVTSHIPNKMMRHTSSTHDVKYTTKSHTITIAVRCARCVVYSTRVIAFSAQSRVFINTHTQNIPAR